MEFYECKVKYRRETGEGKQEKVSETYLIDAISFGDAETRVLEEVKPFVFMGEEIEMKIIKKVAYYDLFNNPDGHFWYKAKASLFIPDEDSGKEKKVNIAILIHETDMENAYKLVKNEMEKGGDNYQIINLQVTNIMDIISLVHKEDAL